MSAKSEKDIPATTYGVPVTVISTQRRRKSVAAQWEKNRLIVRVPGWMNEKQEHDAITKILAKASKNQASSVGSDKDLSERAHMLNKKYLDNAARLGSIRWAGYHNSQWGSCSTETGDIRMSEHLKLVPLYVLDVAIVHELAHTIVADHSPEFWKWARRVDHFDRASGYLEAYKRFG